MIFRDKVFKPFYLGVVLLRLNKQIGFSGYKVYKLVGQNTVFAHYGGNDLIFDKLFADSPLFANALIVTRTFIIVMYLFAFAR